jgi:DNA-directed RNA polymerase specialized sigma subunit
LEVKLLIAWRYLDKQQATLNALNDYKNMETIIEITPQEIKDIRGDMAKTRSSAPDGMPHSRNIRSGENMLCSAIDQCDVLHNRYQQAVEFMYWFTPAWLELSEEERLLLETFYMGEDNKATAVENISEELHIERAQIYRRKDKALNRLTVFLYGV